MDPKPISVKPAEVALITGASSGIGKALAGELAARGRSLVLVALPGTGLEDVASDLAHRYGIYVYGFGINLCDPQAAEKVRDFCREKKLTVDVLVNCAGIGNLALFHRSDWTQLHRIMVLNNQALVELTYTFLPEMLQRHSGHILNVGSLAGFLGLPGKAVYSATKSFVYTFSRSLRTELGGSGVHICCLCPGGTCDPASPRPYTVTETSYRGSMFIQTPVTVARAAVEGMFGGNFRVIPGWSHQLIYLLHRVLPVRISVMIQRRIFTRRPKEEPARVTLPRLSVLHALAHASR
jgi:hypothetical protein